MGWFRDGYDRDRDGDRRQHNRQQLEQRRQRLLTLRDALVEAVSGALAGDAVVQQVVWELAQLDVKAEVTTTVELTYQPLGPKTARAAALEAMARGVREAPQGGAGAADGAGASLGDAVPLMDDADQAWLGSIGITTEQ